uniref:Uncharacterized protein n=1 Tax=Solanum lycopersicum TaxID=4081 RepID=A0A3Q7G884_SOLLC
MDRKRLLRDQNYPAKWTLQYFRVYIYLLHRLGMRTGNHNLQSHTVANTGSVQWLNNFDYTSEIP